MDLSYRPLPPAHEPAFRRLLSYAFSPEDGPDSTDSDRERPEIFRPRGLYAVETPPGDGEGERGRGSDGERGSEGGAPAATVGDAGWGPVAADDLHAACAYYAFTARVRGTWRSVGGVSAVVSPPETRRRGHVSAMLDGLHRELREAGFGFAALWPFDYGFYRRLGYAMANESDRATVSPADLGAVAADPAGEFRRLGPADYAELDGVYDAWATEALALRRTEGWWRHRVFAGRSTEPYVYGWERDGDLRGYLVYTVEGDGDGKTMAVSELAAVDAAARRQLLRFCRDHDSQVDDVRLRGPVAADLLGALDDPRAADVERRPGPMVRLVDVEAALAGLAYPDGVAESVTLAVEDERCPWNDGVTELTVGEAGATCVPSEGAPDCRLGVGAFSQLAVGARSARWLAHRGRLTAEEPAVEALGRLFPAAPVYLREGF